MKSNNVNLTDRKLTEFENTILIFFMISIVVIISFSNSGGILLRGLQMLIFFTIIFLVPIINGKTLLRQTKILYLGLILVVYNIFTSLINFNNYISIYNGLLYSGLILFFLVMTNLKFRVTSVEIFISKMSLISKMLIILDLFFLISNFTFEWYSGTSYLFLFLYFVIIDKKTIYIKKIFYVILWGCVAFVDEQRTFILLLPVIPILIMLWKVITSNKKIYSLFIVIIIMFLFGIPIFYVWLSNSVYRSELDQIAIMYTNSRFFSGRDVIWTNLLTYYLDTNVFIGGGHHVSPEFVYNQNISAHNTYIAILVRTGLIGVIFFINLIKKVWDDYYEYCSIPAVKYSLIFLIISLLKQSSELSLIGNNTALSMINWTIIAFGYIYINSLKNE